MGNALGALDDILHKASIDMRHFSKADDYYIMLKQTCVCKICGSGVVEIFREDLVPFDIYLEGGSDGDLENNKINFYAWCVSRLKLLI